MSVASPSISHNEAFLRRRTYDVLSSTKTHQGLQRLWCEQPGPSLEVLVVQVPLVVAASGAPFTPTAYQRHASFQFSFASLMVTIALIAVLLGAFRLRLAWECC